MVDKYIPHLTLCLRDSNNLVRQQSLVSLSRLLQEDFLKWKGTLFFKFAVTMVDDDIKIQNMGI